MFYLNFLLLFVLYIQYLPQIVLLLHNVIGINNDVDFQAYRKGFIQGVNDATIGFSLEEASYSNQYVDKNRIASNKYKQANDYKASYDSLAQVASEKQFDDDNIDKKAVKGAKGARGKHKKLDLAVKALRDITTEMKSLAREYSKADGVEKEKIKDKLKLKTPKKKELEALVAKLEKNVV
ncbi:hypothetical protein BVX94_01505 [bacterium B17]|nr:hypothetical protein BVX94_01505 [bacterium B17]